MDEIAYEEVGVEHLHDQKNCRKISPRNLCRGGTRNPIRVDISTTRHLGHRGRVCRSGENDSGNRFSSSFLRKEKTPLNNHRISKYNTVQESQTGTPEFSNVSKGEIPKLPEGERGID